MNAGWMNGSRMTRDGQLALVEVRGVEVAYWDPRRRTGTWGEPTRRSRAVHNFGDLLGPLVVRELVRALGLRQLSVRPDSARRPRRLLAIGSILHFARPGDVVWGPGVNPKVGTEVAEGLDLRSVRGPRTAALIAAGPGAGVPALGDPGLLLGALRPELVVPPNRRRGIAIVPNLNDLGPLESRRGVVNPRWRLGRVVRSIARSELVVGSSLHAVIVAESLGVPARAVRSAAEGWLKYEDYYLATGRDPDAVVAETVPEAVARGGAESPRWGARPLLDAFPRDLWLESKTDPSPMLARIAGRATAAIFEREVAG